MPINFENLSASLATYGELKAIKRKKSVQFHQLSVKHCEVKDHLKDGWYISKEFKAKTRLQRAKLSNTYFKDEVWCCLMELGFKILNRDYNFRLPHNREGSETQKIDLFAADEEIALVVVCGCFDEVGLEWDCIETLVEVIEKKKEGFNANIKKLLGNKSVKVGYILATKNYHITELDKKKLQNIGIAHFDYEDISYYRQLAKHLGTASRFQLEAYLFPNKIIPNIENKAPALQGKMGGHTYYSFSIEPAKLLKLGYVLHRSKAIRLLPSYQRLIKKERLKSIRNFVEDGGFFPNSIIVNIDTNGRGLQLDLAQGQVKNAVSKIGVLHLPQKYRSVYIIDGQHRLYGYSESKYAETNSIPVVAFVDLQRKDQLKMFMEINENQKSVSRNLKNTLDPDIKWNSELLHERIDGLQKQIAQDFGEKTDSPLYQRVMVGEDGEKSDYKSITLQAIVIGLKGTNFFGSYSQSNTIIKDGTFFLGDNDRTYKVLIPFLFASFNHLEEIMPQEWQLTAKQGAILTVNSGITATIRLFDEILNHLILTKEINPKAMPTQKIMDEMKYYLDPLASYFDNLSESERKRIRSLYGAGAVTKVLRKLQMVINDVRADFNPEGLDEYRRDHSKQYNETSYKIVAKIEHFLSIKIRELLEKFYESRWLKDGVPRELQKELAARATEKNVEIDNPDDEKEPWDELYIIEYRKIVSYGKNWSTIFQNEFTRPHEANLRKDEKTKWIDKLSRIRNKLSHNDSVSLIEFEFLEGLRDWIQ